MYPIPRPSSAKSSDPGSRRGNALRRMLSPKDKKARRHVVSPNHEVTRGNTILGEEKAIMLKVL